MYSGLRFFNVNSTLDYINTPLSYYLDARYGYILKIGLIMFGAAEILIAAYLYLKKREILKICAILLFIAGVCVIISALSPVNYEDIELTLSHYIHVYTATAQLLFLPLAAFLYGRTELYDKIKYISKSIGIITFCLFVVILIILNFEESKIFKYYGLLQKIDIFLMIVWVSCILNNQLKSNH